MSATLKKRTLEVDRGAFVIDRIRKAGKDIEATLKKLVGNASAAKVLRYALLWSGKSTLCEGDWFYKTRSQWEEETGLSESNYKTAIKHLRQFLWWKDESRTLPWGRAQHYFVDIEAVLAEVEKLLAPRKPKLVKDAPEEAPKVSEINLGGPVESTGPPAASVESNQPDASGGINQRGPVDSAVSSMYSSPTPTNTPNGNSHSPLAPVVDLSHKQEEREAVIDVSYGEKEGGEAAVNELAAKLIALQSTRAVVSQNDRRAATELTKCAILNDVPDEIVLRLFWETMIELSQKPGQFCIGLAAAIHPVQRKLLAVSVTEARKVRDEQYACEVEAKMAEIERERAERAHEEEESRTAEAAAREQKEDARLDGLKKDLLEYSAGRVRGVSESVEIESLNELLREIKSPDDLKAAFDWCTENIVGDEALGWSVVNVRFEDWVKFRMRSAFRLTPASRVSAGTNNRTPSSRIRSSNPVFKVIASVCCLDANSCSDRDYRDLIEAYDSYMSQSGRLALHLKSPLNQKSDV